MSNIYLVEYVNNTKNYKWISVVSFFTKEEAVEDAKNTCERWSDQDNGSYSFNILEYTLVRSK